MADKDDDFNKWLDDTDSEQDQNDIDELLSAAEAMEPEGNDLDVPVENGKTSGELDQDNIDALLGLTTNNASSQDSAEEKDLAELDQDNIDALLSDTGYDAEAGEGFSLDELDQDNIDALLNDSDNNNTSDDLEDLAQDNIDALLADTFDDIDAEGENQQDLDQDDINSLLGNTSEDAQSSQDDDLDELFAADDDNEPPASQQLSPEPSSSDDLDDFDQDNIDALLTGIDGTENSQVTASASAPKDNSLDDLLGADDRAAETSADELSGLLSSEDADDELAATAFDSDLDDMDQLFADLDSDIEEDDPFQAEEIDFAEMLGQTEGDDQEFIELNADGSPGPDTEADDFMTQAGAEDDSDSETLPHNDKDEKKATGLMIPPAIAAMNKGVLAGIGGGITLLLLLGLFFLFSGTDKTMEAKKETTAPVTEQLPRKMTENFIPATENASYDMGGEGGELAIALTAMDKDDQPLIYEITSQPTHGRLSGTAPLLTYLPDNTFPGEDRFEFTASDGTDISNVATITITGPDLTTSVLAKQEAEKAPRVEKVVKKLIKPEKPLVLAKDVTYFTISTEAVTIDWARLWQETNNTSYTPEEVHVEIVDTRIKGALAKRDRANHIFTPDPYTQTTDTIRYRFKKGGFRSATKTVSINVEIGSPPPEINIAKLADGYLVGQNIIIDATGSRDEARESLQFFWEQVAGVKIDLRPLNTEGSQISFSMPSSFYSDPNPGPTIAVTAVDNTGKKVRKEIKVKMLSRRQTALWRGNNGNVAADPPMQGRYFPWPFDD